MSFPDLRAFLERLSGDKDIVTIEAPSIPISKRRRFIGG